MTHAFKNFPDALSRKTAMQASQRVTSLYIMSQSTSYTDLYMTYHLELPSCHINWGIWAVTSSP